MQIPNFLRRLTAAGASANEQFRQVTRDLVTVEVNTILKENMTAARMPGLAAALLQIAEAYAKRLHDFGVDTALVWAAERPPAGADWPLLRVAPGGQATRLTIPDPLSFELMFDRLGEIARQINGLADDGGISLKQGDSDKYLLRRIEKNSRALGALLRQHPDYRDKRLTQDEIETEQDVFSPPMTAHDMLIVRKIWEVGTEDVLAQTVVTLDGDVMSRMSRSLFELREGETTTENEKVRAMLLSLHDKSLDSAIGNWHSIVAAAASVVSGLVGRKGAAPTAPPL